MTQSLPPFLKGVAVSFTAGGFSNVVLPIQFKKNSRALRNNLTDSESHLWSHLRKKQLLDIQFFRQRPIENYIVDFYAPTAKLVIEIDGSQHFEEQHALKDKQRDAFLKKQGIKVLRFDNLEVLQNMEGVFEVIYKTVEKRKTKSPRRKRYGDPL